MVFGDGSRVYNLAGVVRNQGRPWAGMAVPVKNSVADRGRFLWHVYVAHARSEYGEDSLLPLWYFWRPVKILSRFAFNVRGCRDQLSAL